MLDLSHLRRHVFDELRVGSSRRRRTDCWPPIASQIVVEPRIDQLDGSGGCVAHRWPGKADLISDLIPRLTVCVHQQQRVALVGQLARERTKRIDIELLLYREWALRDNQIAAGRQPNAIYFDTSGGGFSFCLSALRSAFMVFVLLGRRGWARRG